MIPELPRLPKTVPEGLQALALFDGIATDIIIGEAPDGKLMLYAAWKDYPTKPLTPLISRADILCVAEMCLAGHERVRTWAHTELVLAMAMALVGDGFLKPGGSA